MLKLALARILILALHLAPAENQTLTLHVVEAGKYRGAYLVEKPEAGQFMLKKTPADSGLQVLEAESSPRYKQFYTVYVRESGESASINLTKALEALKPFSDKPSQDLELGEGLKLNVSRAGSLLLLIAEDEQKPAVEAGTPPTSKPAPAGNPPASASKPPSAVKPADAKPAAPVKASAADKDTGQILVILEKAFR